MKVTYALAVAATIEQASATFGIGGDVFKYWTGLKPFTCPGTVPVICKPDQVPGYDWKNTPIGPIGGYGGCNFKGWTCKKKFGRRDMLAGRQDDGSKVIEADVGVEGTDNPVISAGDEIGSFDINSFSVESEFDARFEFHYTMADGSSCKQSSDVSSQGTSIVNTQCGGAKSVKIVLPENQRNQKRTFGLLKKLCKVKCHKIDFWCKPPPATTTPPAQTTTKNTPPPQSTSTKQTTSVPGTSTKETTTPPGQTSTISTPPGQTSTISTPPGQTSSVSTPPPGQSSSISTPPGQTSSSISTPPGQTSSSISTPPGQTSSSISTPPGQTSSSISTPPGQTSSVSTPPPGQSSSISTPPGQTSSSISTPPGQSSSSISTPPGQTTTKVTSSVVTTPPASQTTPPGQSTPPPVTITSVITTTYDTTSTVFTTSTKTITSCGPEITSCPIKTPGGTHVVTVTIPVSTTICPVTETRPVVITQTPPAQTSDKPKGTETAPPVPSQSLPCPEAVPRCLESWIHLVKDCSNNADHKCFCKYSNFTDNVFQCLYSRGGSDKDVADSISFFQGICAGSAGENPNIVTGAETITQIITVTPAPQPSGGAVTTIVIDTTVTEPCVTSGTTISGSSTTRVISTAIPVPQVTFTPPVGEKEPVPTGQQPGKPAPGGVVPTTIAPGKPVGTGGVPTVPSGTAPPTVNGAGKAQAGLLGVVAMVLVAAL